MTPRRDVMARFEAFLAEVVHFAEAEPRVVGLVAFGSGAEPDRVDEWSDHDLALVTLPGHEDDFRHDLSWLPEAASIAAGAVEDHGGVQVIYDDGRVVELGFATCASLRGWLGNAMRVLVDKGGVADAVAAIAPRAGLPDDARDARVLCARLLVGVGRARRGEVLSAGHVVRAEALGLLLGLLAQRLPGDERLDSLDPRRRVEQVHPELAARLAAAVRLDPEPAAREILEVVEEHLAPGWPDFPHRAVGAVRRRLGWGPLPPR